MKTKRAYFKRASLFVILLVIIMPGKIFAGWCQGEPLPKKNWFTVFETGYKQRIGDRKISFDNGNSLLTSDIGIMKNISPKTSIGGTFYMSANNGFNYGLRFRYRRWLYKQVSLDISPGLLIGGSNDNIQMRYPGFVGTLSLGVKDLIAFDLQYQSLRYSGSYYSYDPHSYSYGYTPYSNTQSNWYFGARFGSYAAVGTTAVALLVGAIVMLTWDFDMNFGSGY